MANANNTINMNENTSGTFEADLDSIGSPYSDARITAENKAAADTIVAIADIYGVKSTIGAIMVGDEPKIQVTLHSVDEEQLSQIEKKLSISQWSDNVISAIGRARDGITNMGDFALNGAIVPTASAAIQATGRTAQIAGVAAVHIGSVVTSTVIEEGKMTARRLAADPVVLKAACDIAGVASSVKSGISTLFNRLGKSNNSKFTRV